MGLGDWLMEKKIERENRRYEKKGLRSLRGYLLWCIAMAVFSYLFTKAVMLGTDYVVSAEIDIVINIVGVISMIAMLVKALRRAYDKGFLKTLLLPVLYGAGMYVSSLIGMFLYTILGETRFYLSFEFMLSFTPYWIIPAAVGVVIGSLCRICKRK